MQSNDGVSGYTVYYTTASTQPASPSYTYSGTGTHQQQLTGLVANKQYNFWVVALGTKVYYTDSDTFTLSQKTAELAPHQKHTLSQDGQTTKNTINVK